MIRLTPSDIREIHAVMIERYGGIPGEKEPGWIEYMADKPFMELYGLEQYPGLFMKAAVYFEGLATHQYFNDGNKRTAYGCMAVFLELNGFQLVVSDEELFETALKVANKKMDLEQIKNWISLHAKPTSH